MSHCCLAVAVFQAEEKGLHCRSQCSHSGDDVADECLYTNNGRGVGFMYMLFP